MLTMIGKRLMFAIPSLIGVVIVTFLLTIFGTFMTRSGVGLLRESGRVLLFEAP